MAFKAKELGVLTSSTGTGGMLTYLAEDDTLTQVKAPGFWSSAVTGGDAKARRAAEDFVSLQSPDSVGVPILVRGNGTTGMEMDVAYLHTDGRIRLRGGNSNVS